VLNKVVYQVIKLVRSKDLFHLYEMIFLFFIEAHTLVENIRQTYETEINDLKQIIQLFDNTDSNEHMAEIVRLRKKIDELTANKVGFFLDRN
jgi:hypothetical protein